MVMLKVLAIVFCLSMVPCMTEIVVTGRRVFSSAAAGKIVAVLVVVVVIVWLFVFSLVLPLVVASAVALVMAG